MTSKNIGKIINKYSKNVKMLNKKTRKYNKSNKKKTISKKHGGGVGDRFTVTEVNLKYEFLEKEFRELKKLLTAGNGKKLVLHKDKKQYSILFLPDKFNPRYVFSNTNLKQYTKNMTDSEYIENFKKDPKMKYHHQKNILNRFRYLEQYFINNPESTNASDDVDTYEEYLEYLDKLSSYELEVLKYLKIITMKM